MGKPVTCVVAYPSTTKEGTRTKFDMNYYLSTHMPMIDKYWIPHGMKSWSITQFLPEASLDPTAPLPPYIVQTTVHWDSVEDLKKALGAPESQETGADVANFSDVFPSIWVGDVTGTGKGGGS